MSELDDFFAKKDRKKSKNKKYSTSEEMAKKLDELPKKPEKAVKKERLPQEGEDGTIQEQELDEWREFEEEKKDYTGLKIGHLSISANAGDGTNSSGNTGGVDNGDDQQVTYDEAGNEMECKSGPWKRVAGGEAEQPPPEPEKKPEEKKPVAASQPSSGAYVPPSMRNQQAHAPMLPSRLRAKATAPDIHSEQFFPTLAGGKPADKKSRGEGAFEMVAHNKSSSMRQMEQTKNAAVGAKLTLGNRYNTLSNNDS